VSVISFYHKLLALISVSILLQLPLGKKLALSQKATSFIHVLCLMVLTFLCGIHKLTTLLISGVNLDTGQSQISWFAHGIKDPKYMCMLLNYNNEFLKRLIAITI